MNLSSAELKTRVTVMESKVSHSAWLSLSGTSLLHQRAQRCDNHTTYSPFIIISFSFLALKGLSLQGPTLSDYWYTLQFVSLIRHLNIFPHKWDRFKEERELNKDRGKIKGWTIHGIRGRLKLSNGIFLFLLCWPEFFDFLTLTDGTWNLFGMCLI